MYNASTKENSKRCRLYFAAFYIVSVALVFILLMELLKVKQTEIKTEID